MADLNMMQEEVKQSEEIFLLIFHIVNRLKFGESLQLGVEDRLTMLDIEDFIRMKVCFFFGIFAAFKETETLLRIRKELKKMMISPIIEDVKALDESGEYSHARYELKLKRKLAIITAANERDSDLEEECYTLVGSAYLDAL